MATPLTSDTAALLHLRCPRCHEGHLFTRGTFNYAHFTEMPEQCQVCGLPLEPEPGFYWGAMFISYAFNVATVLGVGTFLYFFGGDPPVWVYVLVVALVALLLMPPVLRYSRALMLYWFGGAQYQFAPNWRVETMHPHHSPLTR